MLGETPGAAQPGRVFADLHCHTSASFDSLSRPESVVRAAAARGLTHLAITDHERIDGALAAREAAPAGLDVIVGLEVRTQHGDLIGLYLDHAVEPGLAAVEAARQIHDQGGLVGLPHPFDRFRASGGRRTTEAEWQALLELVDYVETWNARVMVGDGNLRAAEMAHQRGLPGVAASDAHTVMEVGVAYTVLDGPIHSAEHMRAALGGDGRELVTGRSSRLLRAGMPLFKGVQWLRGNRRIQPASA